MKIPPTVLALQDLSSLGRCALTVVLPIISTLGSQAIPLPTALLSNHLGFPHYAMVDFSPHMKEFMAQWDANGVEFDAIISGFLASPEQIKIVQDSIQRYKKEDTLIVIDPAMADHGKLYSVYTADMVHAMKKLISFASVITPNFTEAAFLLNEPYEEKFLSEDKLKNWCKRLSDLGPNTVVITSLPSDKGIIRTACYERSSDMLHICSTPRIDLPVSGTGDIFAATLTGFCLQGTALSEAVQKAVNFVYHCIAYTKKAGVDTRYGVLFEPLLSTLSEKE